MRHSNRPPGCRATGNTRYMEAWELHIDLGLSYPEVARRMGVKEASVDQYMRRARKRLALTEEAP